MDSLFIRRAASREEPDRRQFQNSTDVVADMRRALEEEETAGGLYAGCAPTPEEEMEGPFASGRDTFFGRGVFLRPAPAGEDGRNPGEG